MLEHELPEVLAQVQSEVAHAAVLAAQQQQQRTREGAPVDEHKRAQAKSTAPRAPE